MGPVRFSTHRSWQATWTWTLEAGWQTGLYFYTLRGPGRTATEGLAARGLVSLGSVGGVGKECRARHQPLFLERLPVHRAPLPRTWDKDEGAGAGAGARPCSPHSLTDHTAPKPPKSAGKRPGHSHNPRKAHLRGIFSDSEKGEMSSFQDLPD